MSIFSGKKLQTSLLLADVLLVVIVYVLFDAGVFTFLTPEQVTEVLKPVFFGLIALVPVTLYLMFFSEQVFRAWLKKVASWFLPLTFIAVASVDEGQGLFPMTSDGRSDTAILMMVILFAITLVYALVMRKRLKDVG